MFPKAAAEMREPCFGVSRLFGDWSLRVNKLCERENSAGPSFKCMPEGAQELTLP